MAILYRWIIGAVVVILAVFGINAFKTKRAEPVATGNIKIGAIMPVSGDAAAYGEPGRNTIVLAVNEINAAGGIGGRKLEVVLEDSKCNGKDASSAVTKLISIDKVQAILGGFCSSESLAAVPIAEANKVILISGGSSSPDLTGKSKFFFRTYPSDASQGTVLADLAYNDKGWKKVAFIQEQSDYALGLFKAFEAEFTKLGGTIIKEEFPSNASDFRTMIAKLKAGNPDALMIDPQTPAAADKILKQMKELKWSPALLLNDVTADPKLVKDHVKDLEGAYAAQFNIDEKNPKYLHLAEAYKKLYKADMPWSIYMSTVYDSVLLLAEGLKKVGNDGEKLAKWSRTIKDWPGASGALTILSSGDRKGGHSPVIIKAGKVEEYKE